MPLKNDWANGDLFTPAAANDMANAVNNVNIVCNVKDYGAVGNGVANDRAAIHAARDAAGVGGTVFFPSGTYLIRTQSAGAAGYKFGHGGLVADVAGQTWLLGSAELVLTGWTAFTDPLPAGLTKRENLITVVAPNVRIQGGVLDLSAVTPEPVAGGGPGVPLSHGIAVWSGRIGSGLDLGAHGTGAAGAVIDGVTVNDAPGYGIYIVNTNTVSVTNCKLIDCFQSGVMVQHSNTLSNVNIEDFLIQGNSIKSKWKSYSAGIYVGANFSGPNFDSNIKQVTRARIVDNVVVIPRDISPGVGSFFDGFIGGEAGAVQMIGAVDSVIDNNVIDGGTFGITTALLKSVVISGNTCRGFRACGIETSGGLDDVVVVGNILDCDGASGPFSLTTGLQDPAGAYQPTTTGLLASGGDGTSYSGGRPFNNLSIIGNTITGFTTAIQTHGILLFGPTLFTGLTIAENIISGTGGSSSFRGLQVSAATTNVTITGNTIDGASRTEPTWGVVVAEKSHTGLSISGNNFSNCTRAAFEPAVTGAGTYTDISFTGNLVRNCGSAIRGTGVTAATRLVLDTVSVVTSTATAGGVTNLSSASSEVQRFTGTNTQTVRLPTTEIIIGRRQTIINSSTGAVTIQAASSLETVVVLAAGTSARFTALANSPTTAAQWFVSADYTDARADARVVAGITGKQDTITAGTTAQYYRGDKTFQTLDADAVPDGTTNKAFTATERTKLTGIATGATANSADATLLARANHTGTQLAATISDFSTAADARVTAGITGKENTITAGTTAQYYRGDKTFQTLDADAVPSGTTNKAFTATQETKLAGIATGATANSSDATLLARANHTGTQLAATISDFSAAADARISPATVGQGYFPPGYVSGNYYYCNSIQANGSGALTNGTVRVSPWIVTQSITVTRLFAEFVVAGDAASVYRLGIWNHDATTGKPGTLVLDAGSISTGTGNAGTVATGGTPGVYEITISQALSPGLYWVGGVTQGVTSTQPTIRVVSSANILITAPLGTSLPSAGATAVAFAVGGVTGALGNLTAAISAVAPPRIGFKVS
jgi:hypothetical protein